MLMTGVLAAAWDRLQDKPRTPVRSITGVITDKNVTVSAR